MNSNQHTYGLLGEVLAHSFSPLIHNRLGNSHYDLIEQKKETVADFFKERAFSAINVTIPYKKDALAACDRVSPRAAAIGSVNTVVKAANGQLSGYNTDAFGFAYLLYRSGISPMRKKCLVLGSGGSSVMVQYMLTKMGASEVVVISRSGENNYNNLSRHADAGLIVNTTPVGMYPKTGAAPVELDRFHNLTGVVDLIYNPARTKLLLDAMRLSIPCADGLPMLVAQAKLAHLLFFGKTANDDCPPEKDSEIETITAEIRAKTMNILLVGMPSCGKSTIGQLLSEATGRELIDTDQKIVQMTGKSIPELFEAGGEAYFRSLEHQVAEEFTKQSGKIIATGGGIVTHPENLDLLRQNSLIFFINRPIEQLSTDGRPLSQSNRLSDLLRVRLPLYRSVAHYEIPFTSSPEVANAIRKRVTELAKKI